MFPFMGFCYTKTVNLNLFMPQAIMYSGFYCSPSHGSRGGMFFTDGWYVTNESCVYVSH